MDYEKKYKEALERAKKFEEKYGGGYAEYIFPELAESEDERIRKELKEAFEAYDIESKWNGIPIRSIFAWLEKQKEPENVSASTMAPSCWQKEQKPKAKAKSPLSPHELYDAKIEGISQGRQDVLDHPEQFGLQKPVSISCGHENDAEWSDEDADMLNCCISSVEEAKENRYAYNETDGNTSYDREIDWLKSLRPSWKPSEEHLSALLAIFNDPNNIGSQTCQLALTDLYEQLKKL